MSKIADYMRERFDRKWSDPSWWNLLIVVPWAVAAAFGIHEWTVDRTVAQREKITNGTVTAHEPANHNRYGYTFFVNGTSYTGWDTPRKKEPHVGQQVTVFYDSADPTKNSLTDFAELAADSLGPVPMVLFGTGAVAVYIRCQRRRTRPVIQRTSQT